MREIKFRRWDINPETQLGKYIYFDLDNLSHDGEYAINAIDDTPLQQYTGLKDKNGKEIYEGDIVKGFSGNGVVEWFDNLNWDSGGSIHSGFWCKEWCEYKDEGALSYHDGFSECEVIGNIYENATLLIRL